MVCSISRAGEIKLEKLKSETVLEHAVKISSANTTSCYFFLLTPQEEILFLLILTCISHLSLPLRMRNLWVYYTLCTISLIPKVDTVRTW